MKRTRRNEKISYCGIICSTCPAYVASRRNHQKAQVRIAQLWSNEDYTYDACEISCKGCNEAWGKKFKQCSDCQVRECARKKLYKTCGECKEYPCEQLKQLYQKLDKKIVRIDLSTLSPNHTQIRDK
ncbi:MAG: DUF3795 domain-containing protein [Marinifilaceae bacterium]